MSFSLLNRFNKWSAYSLQKKFRSILLGYFRSVDTSGYDEAGTITGRSYTLLGARDLDHALLVVEDIAPPATFLLHIVPDSYPAKKIEHLPSNSPEADALSELSGYSWEVNNGALYILLVASKDIYPHSEQLVPRYDKAVQRFAPIIESVKKLVA